MNSITQSSAAPRRRWKIGLTIALALLGLWAVSPARPFRPIEPIPPGILDMHCHIAGIGAGGSGCFVSPAMRHNFRFKIYLRSFGVSEEDLQQHGDGLVGDRISESLAQSKYVKGAVLLALDGIVDTNGNLDTNRTEVYVPNEFVADAAARHTNLLFGASINPFRRDALQRLQWAKDHGAVPVKWIPPIMEIDPADPRIIPFYKKMAELKLPLLCHSGKEGSFSGRGRIW